MRIMRQFICLLMFMGVLAVSAEQQKPACEIPKSIPTVDVVIVGGGCAGLAAAFTVAYLNHSVMVLAGDMPGGQLMGSTRVENIPGVVPQTGAEVIEALEQQALSAGARIEYSAATHVQREGSQFLVTVASGKRWRTKAIVLAMGGTPRTLGVPGETALLNTRIFTCAICDGKQTEGKEVYVVGGGDSSIDALLTLHSFGARQRLLVRSEHMRAAPRIQDRLQNTGIIIEYKTRIREVRQTAQAANSADAPLEIVLETPRGVEVRRADFLFYAIGHSPNTSEAWVQQLVKLDEHGYIVVTPRQETSTPGVFAAGDIASPYFHQASYAIGCGQLAAKSAIDYINR